MGYDYSTVTVLGLWYSFLGSFLSPAISAKQYDITEKANSGDLRFPQEQDLVNYTGAAASVTPASVEIPANLLRERLNQTNSTGTHHYTL